MDTAIDLYFQDPNNVSNEVIHTDSGRVSPEEFYGMGEYVQERAFVLMKRIECVDGFNMSVQANTGAYCDPRITIRSKRACYYHEFEIGFPSAEESLIMEYAESPEDPTGTVYAYVPKDIVNQVIAKHGGIKPPEK